MPILIRKTIIWAMAIWSILQVNTATAQHYDTYPKWVSERYCAGWADPSVCKSQLTIDDLNNGDGEGQFPRITTCIYEHPSKPWDYIDECFFTTRANAFAFTTRIGVKNGSSVTLRYVVNDGGGANAGDKFLNGHPAREIEHFGYSCVQALETGEIFCSLPPPERHVSAQEGSCRMDGLGIVMLQNCREEVICQEIPLAGEMACDISYQWENGPRTNMVRCEGFMCGMNGDGISDRRPLSPAWNGAEASCYTNAKTGQEFCFSGTPLDPE